MILFSSTNEGKSWEQQSVIPADQDSFKFYAPRDGTYWFTIDVVDHEGKHNPPDIYKAKPSQMIVIDTLPPSLRIVSAHRHGEEIVVNWEIQEDHPDLASLRMEYRQADSSGDSWNPVPLDPKLIGQAGFRAKGSGAVSVRMHFQDLAKNQATAEKDIPAAGDITTASLETSHTTGESVVPARSSSNADSLEIKNPAPADTGAHDGSSLAEPAPKSHQDGSAVVPPPLHQPAETGTGSGTSSHVVAASDSGTASGALGVEAPVRHGPLPPLQIVKNSQVTVEYTLKDVGPSGIGLVELWLTRDDGQTWTRYARDDETKSLTANGRFQRTVELPGEGIFGISLVVRSRAGLGKPPPKPGDAPQMRIEVDTTAPEAKLFNPVPHPRRRDVLILSWEARDPGHSNLSENPITLQWTERKGGAWQNIAANLANKGQYEWQLPSNLPDRVYLRLVVRDAAGNLGIAETSEPQLVDLSEPQGILLGVVNPANQ
jgi:hypothetical protein